MISLWPHWTRPWWLLALPVLGALLWGLRRSAGQGHWQELLPPRFHRALLDGGLRRASRWPWLLLGLAWLLATLALAGPSWRHLQAPLQRSAEPLVIVLDLSPDMLTGDLTPNRLERARHKLLDLLALRAGSYTGIVVYAGSPHTLVPLTDDLATVTNLLGAVSPQIMPEPGHRADLAVAHALQLLKQSGAAKGRLLLMTSQLSEQERQGLRQALKRQPTRLDILGFGTSEGGPVKMPNGALARDAKGRIRLSRLDAEGLRQQARALGAGYLTARLDDQDVRALGLIQGEPTEKKADQRRLDLWQECGHWLLLPLLLLGALGARRGWLLCLALLLVSLGTPRPTLAMDWPKSWQDLWLRPDQQGQRLLWENRPQEAAKRFADQRWRGTARYQAGDYGAAAKDFAQGDSATDLYNQGNALARGGQLQQALDAYHKALQMDPKLSAARHNQALVEQLLRQRKQQGQQQKKHDQDQTQQQKGQQQQGQQGQQGRSGQQDDDSSPGQAGDGEPGKNGQRADDSRNPPKEDADQTGADGDEAQPQPAPDHSQESAGGSEQDETVDKADGDGQDQEKSDGQTGKQALAAQNQADDKADAQQRAAKDADPGRRLSGEQQQALEQRLRQIPDNPAELMRRKFRYEQLERLQRQRQGLP